MIISNMVLKLSGKKAKMKHAKATILVNLRKFRMPLTSSVSVSRPSSTNLPPITSPWIVGEKSSFSENHRDVCRNMYSDLNSQNQSQTKKKNCLLVLALY